MNPEPAAPAVDAITTSKLLRTAKDGPLDGDEGDNKFPRVLITVGTTSYDDLLTWALDEETKKFFALWNVSCVRCQIGSSKLYHQGVRTMQNITYEFYSFKTTLAEDIEWADLVIGHAGAGTVLEVLNQGKTLFVIPNESLMDNHQEELGEFLNSERYAYSSSMEASHKMMDKIHRSGLRKFPNRNVTGFLELVQKTLGYDAGN